MDVAASAAHGLIRSGWRSCRRPRCAPHVHGPRECLAGSRQVSASEQPRVTDRRMITTMPKMKTHKGAAKRFKVTGKGKLRRRKQGGGHLRRKKSKRVRRSYHQDHPVSEADRKRLKRILGLGKRAKG